jgi:hypothetical protein
MYATDLCRTVLHAWVNAVLALGKFSLEFQFAFLRLCFLSAKEFKIEGHFARVFLNRLSSEALWIGQMLLTSQPVDN